MMVAMWHNSKRKRAAEEAFDFTLVRPRVWAVEPPLPDAQAAEKISEDEQDVEYDGKDRFVMHACARGEPTLFVSKRL